MLKEIRGGSSCLGMSDEDFEKARVCRVMHDKKLVVERSKYLYDYKEEAECVTYSCKLCCLRGQKIRIKKWAVEHISHHQRNHEEGFLVCLHAIHATM